MNGASIAVVGAGPSGLFAAQALAKALPGATIDVLDRLPVPHGLVTFGVAADHQGTKAVTRQFDRLWSAGVGFLGNVVVGRDVAVAELLDLYDAVLLCAGLAGDRRLGIPGDDAPCIVGSGALTRWLNAHPDEPAPTLRGPHVVVVGNGNVALDVARMLAKVEADLQGSDLHADRRAVLAGCGLATIDIVGRGQAAAARFDAVLLREFGALSAARIVVDGAAALDPAIPVCAALRTLDGAGPADAPLVVRFRFGLRPTRVEAGALVATDAAGVEVRLQADTLVTAIGFDGGRDGLPRPGDAPELQHALGGRLYAAGWFRRGPRGTIPDNRRDAKEASDRLVAELSPAGRPGRAGLRALLESRGVRTVSARGWEAIRAAETAAAEPGRVRRKLAREAMMAHAEHQEGTAP